MKAKIDFSKVSESDCIINYIADRYNKGLYTLVLVTGLPGTGKSSVCLRLAELTSLKIHNENRITEDSVLESTLNILKFLRESNKPGHIGCVEELSVLFPSRRAMAQENVTVGRILDTCRKKLVILFANAPIFTSMDSHIRAMAHVLIETQKVYKRKEVVVSKAWKLQTNPHTGKTYRHKFTRENRDVALFITRKPNSEVWKAYEKGKDEFLDNLYDRLERQTQKKQDKQDKELGIKPRRVIKKGLSDREKEVVDLVISKGMTQTAAARLMGVDNSRVCRIVKNINKKSNIVRE